MNTATRSAALALLALLAGCQANDENRSPQQLQPGGGPKQGEPSSPASSAPASGRSQAHVAQRPARAVAFRMRPTWP